MNQSQALYENLTFTPQREQAIALSILLETFGSN